MVVHAAACEYNKTQAGRLRHINWSTRESVCELTPNRVGARSNRICDLDLDLTARRTAVLYREK